MRRATALRKKRRDYFLPAWKGHNSVQENGERYPFERSDGRLAGGKEPLNFSRTPRGERYLQVREESLT